MGTRDARVARMTTTTIDVLNGFLRDELAAVATYNEALHGRSAFSGKTELSTCQRSHETRATILRDKIVSLGGQPAATAGLTGIWSKLVESGAVAIGPEMAIRALEQGEDHVLRDYRNGISNVEPEVRVFLERMVLPEEEYTHRTLSDLKHRLASS
jgi:bacterioferritin (cytochrome b1)